jgi:membrane-associated phospholipid phosphatase
MDLAVIDSPPARPGWRARLLVWAVAAALAAGGGLALNFDAPLARAVAAWTVPDELHEALEFAGRFGHYYSVLLVLGAAFLQSPKLRRKLVRAGGMTTAAGLLAAGVKLIVSRHRPVAYLREGPGLRADSTFGEWPPDLFRDYDWQSFPSAHTATAAALAIAVVWLYPRLRPLAVAVAVAVGAQRVVALAHYPSDVLAGAAIGWCVGWGFLHNPLLDRWLSAFERRGEEPPPATVAAERRRAA